MTTLKQWHRLFMYKADAAKYKEELAQFSAGAWLEKKGGYWVVSYVRGTPYSAGDVEEGTPFPERHPRDSEQ